MKLKTILILLLVVVATVAWGQDSTTIKFIDLDRNQSLFNALNDIQYIGFVCKDTLAQGKKFLILIEEYENGRKIQSDSTDLICKEELIPMTVEGKTINYRFDLCSRKIFSENDSAFTVAFAGKLNTDTFNLFIDYPAVRLNKKLKGKADYSLRNISCETDDSAVIPFNKLTPVFAYTPPFDTGKGFGSYCILGTEDVENWFQKFGVKHYYILYLIIE